MSDRDDGAAHCAEQDSRGNRCEQAAGHGGAHTSYTAADGAHEWGDEPERCPSTAPSDDTGDVLESMLTKALRAQRPVYDVVRLPAPPAVRVRFVDLPPRHGEMRRGPLGMPIYTIEPGGFALVVDRFVNFAHRDREREHWEGFGAKIGANAVLLHVGDLDITGWIDAR